MEKPLTLPGIGKIRLRLVTTAHPPPQRTSSPSSSRHCQEEGEPKASSLCLWPQRLAYLSLLITILHAQSIHGPDNGCQRLDGVAVDNRLVLLYIFSREAVFMDDPGGKPQTTPDEQCPQSTWTT